jgi:hypothetical protein
MQLSDLESLTHRARTKKMVEVGRAAAASDTAAQAFLAELRASPDAYARALAVIAGFGDRNGEAVVHALSDRSRVVRARATRLAPVLCSDAQLQEVLGTGRIARMVAALVVALRRHGRGGVVDTAIAARLAADARDLQAIDLLPCASPALIERHLPTLRDLGSPITWSRLARWQPELAARELARQIDESPTLDFRLRWRTGGVLAELAERAPDACLALIDRLCARGEQPGSHLFYLPFRHLVRRRPRELFDLLRAQHERAAPAPPPGVFAAADFTRGAHRLGAERLAYLIEHAPTTLADGDRARRWFLRLPQADRAAARDAWLTRGRGAWGAFLLHGAAEGPIREAAYRRWADAAQNLVGVIELHKVDYLPRDLRTREALRHLNEVTHLTSRPRERVPYARLLGFDDARVALAPWLGHPEGEERAVAGAALVASVRHDRARLPAALDYVHARRFEQDPVRMALLQALSQLPVGAFTAEHLPAVGQIIQDALDAADLSHGSANFVKVLVVRLFRLDARWGAKWLTALLAARGSLPGIGFGAALTPAEVRTMTPVLAALASDWATRERAGALIWLADGFGVRLKLVTPLLDALERLARENAFVNVAGIALELLRRRARTRFVELVPQLLAKDPTYIVFSQVARWVSLARQDLLDPFLQDRRMRGRFGSGRTSWVILFGVGHTRWTSRQHGVHAKVVAALAHHAKADVPEVRAAIEELARLTYAPPDELVALASDRRPPVREIAVRALPWLDGGTGAATLLECLGDDRARWAIYALRKAFQEMPAPRIVEILRAAPTAKVTVAKEIVRLLGEVRDASAYPALLAMGEARPAPPGEGRSPQKDRPDLHRDVRIALLRAMWDHLDREESWALFERAAVDPDWVLASRVADVPTTRLSAAQEERLIALYATILARKEPEARLELLGRAGALPVRDAARTLFRRCVDHLQAATPINEAGVALNAALTRMIPGEAPILVARVRGLLADRRLAMELIDVIVSAVQPWATSSVREVATGVMAALADDRLAVRMYLRLAGALLEARELAAVLAALAGRGLLHADAVACAHTATTRCVHPDLLEEALGHADEPVLRRLGLAALAQAAARDGGWTAARRARLAAYRADPAPLVAEEAQFTFPPEA